MQQMFIPAGKHSEQRVSAFLEFLQNDNGTQLVRLLMADGSFKIVPTALIRIEQH